MENIAESVYKALLAHTEIVQGAVKEYESIEKKIKDNRYSPQTLKDEIYPKREAAERKIDELRDAAIKDVNEKIAQYKKSAADRNRLDPGDITADIRLLQPGIVLTASDIQGMLERNKSNRTMSQIILRYAQEHNIDTGGTLFIGGMKEEEEAKDLKEICRLYQDWIDKPQALEILHEFFIVPEEDEE